MSLNFRRRWQRIGSLADAPPPTPKNLVRSSPPKPSIRFQSQNRVASASLAKLLAVSTVSPGNKGLHNTQCDHSSRKRRSAVERCHAPSSIRSRRVTGIRKASIRHLDESWKHLCIASTENRRGCLTKPCRSRPRYVEPVAVGVAPARHLPLFSNTGTSYVKRSHSKRT